MCELLGWAAINDNGKLQMPQEAAADQAAVAMLGFLVEQRWLAEDGTEAWTITPAGRFWFQSLDYGDTVKFHEYRGAMFLLQVRLNRRETIVWHKGRFLNCAPATWPSGTISPATRGRESTA